MNNVIMVGADVHDKSILLKVALGKETPVERPFHNHFPGRKAMYRYLLQMKEDSGAHRIVFAYEASPVGFGLYDELTAIGAECHVLAPTKIARSVKHRRRKTDPADALRLLEIVRGHVLAGNTMPSIWIPDPTTRDDRELLRTRIDVGKKITVLKAQILALTNRNDYRKPAAVGDNWSKGHREWLGQSLKKESALPPRTRLALGSLTRQLLALEEEKRTLDQQVKDLAKTERYRPVVKELTRLKGVGILTAMVFLTEIGDLSRFGNRRELGSYLGLVPSSYESGERNDRKGHITHHGPYRLRKVLCQASWSRVRTDPNEKKVYGRIVARNPKMKKIAVVAEMRRLGIMMWHVGLKAQREAQIFAQVA